MKKMNNKGFVLAETLVVTVFLMAIFALIYSSYMPLVGEYEKREVYDDVDGKYTAYWIKQMIESQTYSITGSEDRNYNFEHYGYVRFECKDLSDNDSRIVCKDIVNSLQINGCTASGNNCDIFITRFRIGNADSPEGTFKEVVKNNLTRSMEKCTSGNASTCKTSFVSYCNTNHLNSDCSSYADKKVFSGGFQDYILSLPDYVTPSLNYANYRVIVVIHNTRDNNNYYAYANIAVSR